MSAKECYCHYIDPGWPGDQRCTECKKNDDAKALKIQEMAKEALARDETEHTVCTPLTFKTPIFSLRFKCQKAYSG